MALSEEQATMVVRGMIRCMAEAEAVLDGRLGNLSDEDLRSVKLDIGRVMGEASAVLSTLFARFPTLEPTTAAAWRRVAKGT